MARRSIAGRLARLAVLLEQGDRAALEAAQVEVVEIRREVSVPRRRAPADESAPHQLELVLALRMAAEAPVRGCPLGCRDVRAVVCVARQLKSEAELSDGTARSAKASKRKRRAEAGRTLEALERHKGKRGRAPSRPTCVTERCKQGAAVRALLGDTPEAVALAEKAPSASDTSEG